MKVPTITAVRIAILIASFAFIFFIFVVLCSWESCFGSSVASDLTDATGVPNP